jgi:hypothetical protein
MDKKNTTGKKERYESVDPLPGPVGIIVIAGGLKTDMITVDVCSTDYHIKIRIGCLDNAVGSTPVKDLFSLDDGPICCIAECHP